MSSECEEKKTLKFRPCREKKFQAYIYLFISMVCFLSFGQTQEIMNNIKLMNNEHWWSLFCLAMWKNLMMPMCPQNLNGKYWKLDRLEFFTHGLFHGLFFVIWTNPRNNEQHGNNEQRALMITFLSSNVDELCCVNSSSKFEEKILKIGLGRIIHLWFVFCHLGFAKNKPQNVTWMHTFFILSMSFLHIFFSNFDILLCFVQQSRVLRCSLLFAVVRRCSLLFTIVHCCSLFILVTNLHRLCM